LAAVDIAGFVALLKEHAVEHRFHVHDERHFIETYTLRQNYEVDCHPESACGEPLDLHLSLEVEPRILLAFEDRVNELDDDDESPEDEFHLPMFFNWGLPPLENPPDLLILATELAGIGGPDLPMNVSAIDSTEAVTDAPERRLNIVGRVEISLTDVFMGRQPLCDALVRAHAISEFLLDSVEVWRGDV
jgi:hypothetical protein